MAKKPRNPWLWLSTADLETELQQLRDEGKDPKPLLRRFRALMRLGDDKLARPENQAAAATLLDDAQKLALRRDFPHREPSDLASIRKLRQRGPRTFRSRLPSKTLADKFLGAWLGRCAGCLLGKPVEGVRTADLWDFLKLSRQWPLAGYIRFGVRGKAREKHPALAARTRFDKLDHMPVDDDTNYTVVGHLVVERHGADFTPDDVAQFWLGNLPILSTCTAERVAYRNLVAGLTPPETARRRNPYREWIGAQIRADAFGYLAAGNPQQAAAWAWRDASISHVKNGIYGEMFVAAMIAAAPWCPEPAALVHIGLSEIPRSSRLHDAITEVCDWYRDGLSYDEAVEQLHSRWDEGNRHHWCHTISNAAIVTIALLWGDGDFGKSVCRAVQPCFDTDCNGATVGSIMGMMLGAKAIPARWTERLNDTLHTSIVGHQVVRISEMAHRTLKLHKRLWS